MEDVLRDAAERAIACLAGIDDRRVPPDPAADLSGVTSPFPDDATDPALVIKLLDDVVSSATMAMAGPRFHGWVIGGAHPAALAADWLVSAWDQNTLFADATPGTVAVEAAAIRWVVEATGLPAGTWGAFVTGTTGANVAALGAACAAVLVDAGWDAPGDGLFGAPPVAVVVGAEAHPSLMKALGIVGLGRNRVVTVPTDDQGRMRVDALPTVEPPAVVYLQAGNVNSGACDPFAELVPLAKELGAWVHVDDAFGFWAAAAPSLCHLTAGMAGADSWATDAHKYLNVPYDAGLVLVHNPTALERVMSVSAAYLPAGDIGRDPLLYTLEMSRRARGVPTWAVLKALGRTGLAELVESRAALARRFAGRLAAAGLEILNDVVLNQVLVGLESGTRGEQVVDAIQADGTLFAGATEWHGRAALRISVCSWKTTADDVDRAVQAIVRHTKPDDAVPRATPATSNVSGGRRSGVRRRAGSPPRAS